MADFGNTGVEAFRTQAKARGTLTMQGGIGMTDAHDAGLHLKRARAVEALSGTTAWRRDRRGRMHGY